MTKKIALITGISGQDGSYLAEFLLEKNYQVHGIKRRSSSFNTDRIDHIIDNKNLFLHYGDLSDPSSINNLLDKIRPDEVYNLAAQSHVSVSFEIPDYTADIDALGALRILESIRALGLTKTKFYQASSSELYGLVQEPIQNETTPFYPRSPYAVSKLFAYWITINYRESYNIFACNGILFNHESPRRGETFVTRKITRGLSRITQGLEKTLKLGNIYSLRDWGHAKDFVKMQWMMLQQDTPDDYVISTGKQYSIKDFILWTCENLGIGINFSGSGLDEIATIKSLDKSFDYKNLKVGDIIIEIDKKYYRPAEVDTLLGDSSKAKAKLNWSPNITAQELCKEMTDFDLNEAQKERYLKEKFNDF